MAESSRPTSRYVVILCVFICSCVSYSNNSAGISRTTFCSQLHLCHSTCCNLWAYSFGFMSRCMWRCSRRDRSPSPRLWPCSTPQLVRFSCICCPYCVLFVLLLALLSGMKSRLLDGDCWAKSSLFLSHAMSICSLIRYNSFSSHCYRGEQSQCVWRCLATLQNQHGETRRYVLIRLLLCLIYLVRCRFMHNLVASVHVAFPLSSVSLYSHYPLPHGMIFFDNRSGPAVREGSGAADHARCVVHSGLRTVRWNRHHG